MAKRLFFVKTADVVAGYMGIFEKDYVSNEEIGKWADFICQKLKERFPDSLVLNKMGAGDLNDAEYRDLFVVLKDGVALARGVTIDNIREKICASTNLDILMTMTLKAKEFKESPENNDEINEKLAM